MGGRPPYANLGSSFANLGGLLNNLGGTPTGQANPNFMDMHQQLQSEIINNPEFLRDVLNNPLVQNLMTNPENMRSLITSNPQMQELMDVSSLYNLIELKNSLFFKYSNSKKYNDYSLLSCVAK